jgi:hypothetical protein
MPNYDTTLSGAGYQLTRVFLGIWRWRVFPVHGDGTGLAWGRRGAMRAARRHLRDLQPPRTLRSGAACTLPVPAKAAPERETAPKA